MKTILLFQAAALALLLGFGAGTAEAQRRGAATDEFTAEYGVLLENNIFRRDRSRPAEPRPQPQMRNETPPPPGQSYMLTGVVFEDGQFRAYFETAGTPQIIRVTRGDEIAGGTVMDIALDAVAFETGGMARWIEIGQDLTGTTATRPAATVSANAGGGSGSGELVAPEGVSDEERRRILTEQMRQRRARPGR